MKTRSTQNPLLIVDLQVGFITTPETKEVSLKVQNLQERYDHIVATKFINEPDSQFVTEIGMVGMQAGDSNTDLAFDPTSNVVVVEGCKYGAKSKKFLKELEKIHPEGGLVDVCGIETDASVLASCYSIFDDCKWSVNVLPDYCASNVPGRHEEAITIIQRNLERRVAS